MCYTLFIKNESGAIIMFRLTILLCATLFLSLQILGEDRGQMRMGLVEAEKNAALIAEQSKAAPQSAAVIEVAAQSNVITPARPAQDAPAQTDGVVSVAFSPSPLVVTNPRPQPAEQIGAGNAQATLEATLAPQEGAVKYVSGRSVNVRGGPSTQDAVVGRLTRGEAVTIVWIEDNGWARIRVEGDGIDGFMSMDFLSDAAQ